MEATRTQIVVQGRSLTESDLNLIRSLIRDNADWHRTRLSRELCTLWQWHDATGRQKDMACRTMLLKLERRGLIRLPERAAKAYNHLRGQRTVEVPHATDPIECKLSQLLPISIIDIRADKHHQALFRHFVHKYHYLGYKTNVGESLRYMAVDCLQRPIACLVFGAPAWKAKPRDSFIGWDPSTRQRNLQSITNNTRFLILPWVKVRNLASFLLSRCLSRLSEDWQLYYGHSIVLVETFVDRSRFHGTCYRAANWCRVGQTKGRTRNDRFNTIKAPIKDIYVYPLTRHFRSVLKDPLR